MLLQPVPRRGRKAKSQLLDAGSGQLPRLELLAGARAARPRQLFAKIGRRRFVHFEQFFAQPGIGMLAALFRALLRQRDADLLRQQPDGIRKRDPFLQLHELEYIAAGMAAEAVKEPLLLIDGERRRLLGVKRAEAFELQPRLLQRDVLVHHADNVRLQAKIIDKAL